MTFLNLKKGYSTAMGLFSKWRIHKSAATSGCVEVSEKHGIRSLHLGSETVQSAMRLSAPNNLELHYTRSMMAFLLFHPAPKSILMIGLGGGSMVKFAYHHLPETRINVVEINDQVIAIARNYFFLPADDDRLSVMLEDGAAYVAQHPGEADVILLDGFDGTAPGEVLTTQDFYDSCFTALAEEGILVVNLWGGDKKFQGYLSSIKSSFADKVLCLPAEHFGNVIVLAFRSKLESWRWDDLRALGRKLEGQYKLEFMSFVEAFKKMNRNTDKRLFLTSP